MKRPGDSAKMSAVDWGLAALGVVLGLAAMAVDHLLGDDPGLEDPVAFVVSAVLIVILAAVLFGAVVRRASRSQRTSVLLAAAAIASLVLIWLGAPFVVAPAAVAVGLRSTGKAAAATLVVGALVLVLATGAYAFEAANKL